MIIIREEKKVSVCLTFHQNKEYAIKCFENILNQTLDGIELICIVDNTCDDILELIDNISKTYCDMQVINIEQEDIDYNKINGEYVFLLNSQNWLSLAGLEYIYNLAVENNSEIVLSSAYEYDEKTKNIYEVDYGLDNKFSSSKIFSPEMISKEIFSMPKYTSNLYKTSFLNKLNMNLYLNEYNNSSFFFKTIFSASRISFSNKPIITIRKNSDNKSSIIYNDFNKNLNEKKVISFNIEEFFKNMDNIIPLFKDINVYDFYKYNLLNYIIGLYRNICEFNLKEKELYYKKLHETIIDYSNKYHTDFVLNLNLDNLKFYRNLIKVKTEFELELLEETKTLKITNEKLINEINNPNRKSSTQNKNKSSSQKIQNNKAYVKQDSETLIASLKEQLEKERTSKLNERKYKKQERFLKMKLEAENKKLNKKLDEVLNSNSWKLMATFRKIGLRNSIILFGVIVLLIIFIIIILIIY